MRIWMHKLTHRTPLADELERKIEAQRGKCGRGAANQRLLRRNRGAQKHSRFKRSTGCTDYRRYCTVREKDRDIRADGDDAFAGKQEKQKTLALFGAEATDTTAQSDTLSERAHIGGTN